MMSVRSRSHVLFATAVLIASLAVLGCPKRPEVGQAGPGAVGPSAATVPSAPSGQAGTRAGEVPVTRATPPSESQVSPAPSPAAPGGQPSAGGPAAGAPGAGAPGAGAPGFAAPGAPAPGAGAPGFAAPGAPAPGAAGAAAQPGVAAASPLKDVFFDFDRAAIRDDQKASLNENVAWLKQNGRAKITLEGHCDERGANEYNLALGERRAKAVKDYLVAAGVAADRIATVSYGEERPFVLGHDESAWKWNRRGHFVASGQ
jgi:peptidoglycan-associated lipoprotein